MTTAPQWYLHRNIKKAWGAWGQFRKVFKKEEVPSREVGMFYQAVIASILL